MNRAFIPAASAAAIALFVFTLARSAQATCSVSCEADLVDDSCNALPSDQLASGASVRVYLKCSTLCCAGPSSCGSSPKEVPPADVTLFPVKQLDSGGQSPSETSVGSFSAHPTCANVYVFQGCLSDGGYWLTHTPSNTHGSLTFDVTGDTCASDDGGESGCAVEAHGAPGTSAWIAFGALVAAFGLRSVRARSRKGRRCCD